MKNVTATRCLCHYRVTPLIVVLMLLMAVTCFSAEKGYSNKVLADSINHDPAIKNLIAEALAAEDAGNLPVSIELHKKVLESQPKNVLSINSIAGLYGVLEKFDEEAFWAKKAIEIDPNFDLAYINYANAMAQLGKIAEAKKAYEKAAELNPKSPIAFFNLGILAEQVRDIPQAIKYYKKSIVVDSKFESGYLNLAARYANSKQFAEAISTLKKLLIINPKNADAREMLADIERDKKRK